MRVAISKTAGFLATALYVLFGLYAFFLDLAIVHSVLGFWGIVAGIVLAPVLFVAAPFYALFEYHNGMALAVTVMGLIIPSAFLGIAALASPRAVR
jgi:hypothetical protein